MLRPIYLLLTALEIPYGYPGTMGVPLAFLDRFNPGQFEILGLCENMDPYGLKSGPPG